MNHQLPENEMEKEFMELFSQLNDENKKQHLKYMLDLLEKQERGNDLKNRKTE
ncbi:MAG: hypothetical protein IJJ25_02455 [Lachnospiraceae bacterium]|nr:hypothetical protein [Lachnospiraceae bacterium]